MDGRIGGIAVIGLAAALAVFAIGGVDDPLDDLSTEVPVAPRAIPSEEAVAAGADEVATEPVSDELPTPEQLARIAAAGKAPLTLQEALAPEPEAQEPEAWRPPVVASDTRERRSPPGVAPQPEPPLAPDVVGLEKLLVARSAKVDVCMRWSAPAKARGEDRVVVRFTIVPDGASNGKITKIDAPGDTTGRYASFLRCLADVVADATFAAPRTAEEVVSWALQR